jgi:hypothetical protein
MAKIPNGLPCGQSFSKDQIKKALPCGQSFSRIKQKSPAVRQSFSIHDQRRSTDFRHVGGLGSFLPLNNFEFDLIPLGERFET